MGLYDRQVHSARGFLQMLSKLGLFFEMTLIRADRLQYKYVWKRKIKEAAQR